VETSRGIAQCQAHEGREYVIEDLRLVGIITPVNQILAVKKTIVQESGFGPHQLFRHVGVEAASSHVLISFTASVRLTVRRE
jgi:hypothetical protein